MPYHTAILKWKWKFTFNLNVWAQLCCYKLQFRIHIPSLTTESQPHLVTKISGHPHTHIWGPGGGKGLLSFRREVRITRHQGIPPSQEPITVTPERNLDFSRRAQILSISLFSAKIICGPAKKRNFLCSTGKTDEGGKKKKYIYIWPNLRSWKTKLLYSISTG